MKVHIHTTSEFKRMAKPLAKKYKSFEDDYNNFLDELEENPNLGTSLGHGVFKVRMAIASKGKGKSGGARVLTFHVNQINDEEIDVSLLSIYDKGEIDNVSDAYIKQIVKNMKWI